MKNIILFISLFTSISETHAYTPLINALKNTAYCLTEGNEGEKSVYFFKDDHKVEIVYFEYVNSSTYTNNTHGMRTTQVTQTPYIYRATGLEFSSKSTAENARIIFEGDENQFFTVKTDNLNTITLTPPQSEDEEASLPFTLKYCDIKAFPDDLFNENDELISEEDFINNLKKQIAEQGTQTVTPPLSSVSPEKKASRSINLWDYFMPIFPYNALITGY